MNDDRDDDENIEYTTNSLVAICYSNKYLGVACFQEITDTIKVASLSVSVNDMDETLNTIKQEFTPTLFLVHPSIVQNKPLLDLLTTNEADGTPDYYRFKTMKSSNWNEKKSLEIICQNLKLRGDHLKGNQRINSLIDLDNSGIVQPLGACKYLNI